MEKWIAEVVGKMHIHKINQSELAEYLGIRRDYLNKILNGAKAPANAEERIVSAVDNLIANKS